MLGIGFTDRGDQVFQNCNLSHFQSQPPHSSRILRFKSTCGQEAFQGAMSELACTNVAARLLTSLL